MNKLNISGLGTIEITRELISEEGEPKDYRYTFEHIGGEKSGLVAVSHEFLEYSDPVYVEPLGDSAYRVGPYRLTLVETGEHWSIFSVSDLKKDDEK